LNALQLWELRGRKGEKVGDNEQPIFISKVELPITIYSMNYVDRRGVNLTGTPIIIVGQSII